MEKLRIREVVIVEGKYDKIKLEALIEGVILPTNGFQIFRDPARVQLIRRLAKERGVLILTDSDGAGKVIRGYLSGILPPDRVKHAFIPDVIGKEKRKRCPSKEGKIGVEGMELKILRQVLARSGVCEEDKTSERPTRVITKMDFYVDGLSGKAESVQKRKRLQKWLGLPENLTTNYLLQVLNSFLSYEEYRQLLKDFDREGVE